MLAARRAPAQHRPRLFESMPRPRRAQHTMRLTLRDFDMSITSRPQRPREAAQKKRAFSAAPRRSAMSRW